MADFFIRRPIVAMVIAILTVIVGGISLSRLPIAEYPPVSPTLIKVTATYRGAAAEAVMESVATPLESKVNGVDKLIYMQSYNANDGKMYLNVYFDVGTDVDIMQVNTQNRVGQAEAQLPDAVKREGVVVDRSSPDILLAIGLSSPHKTYDSVFLGNYLDINIVDAIKRVKGVGAVQNFTAQDYSLRIWLRPDKLASLGVTPQDISNAIKEQNAQSPAGRIGAEPAPPQQEMQFNVRALGLLKDPKEFAEIIIRSNPDGPQVKIKDVGRVELGAQTYDIRARSGKHGSEPSSAAAIGVFLAPGANAIEAAQNTVRQTLVSQVARTYLTLLELDYELAVARRTLDARTNSLALTTAREEGGVAAMQDVRQAQILVATAEGSIVEIHRLIEQKENELCILLGRNPGPVTRGAGLLNQNLDTSVPPGLPSSLLERRPDLRSAEEQLVAANADVGQAQAAFFPQITLTGFYGYQTVALSDLFTSPARTWQFGPAVSFPVFTGGALRGNLKLAKARFDEAVAQYQKTVQNEFREVSDGLIDYQRSREFRARQEERTQAHRSAAELATIRYEGGVTSYLEVLYNEQELFDAELRLAQARLGELLSVVQPYRTLGGGWQIDPQRVSQNP